MKKIQNAHIGIIGFGSFGRYLAGLLPSQSQKSVFDIEDKQSDISNLQFVSLNEVAEASDIIFLAIPLDAYDDVLPHLKDSRALMVDVSSVKLEPTKQFEKYFGQEQELLLTHPLFGPETAKNGLDGFKFIVTKKHGARAQQVMDYFAEQGAEVIETSAEEHDQQMAYTHVLTFFISRALLRMDISNVKLSAPSFQKLLDLENLESHHSQDLFKTIQRGNPYGGEVRQQLIRVLKELEDDINGQDN